MYSVKRILSFRCGLIVSDNFYEIGNSIYNYDSFVITGKVKCNFQNFMYFSVFFHKNDIKK